jgi:hypothetical protein
MSFWSRSPSLETLVDNPQLWEHVNDKVLQEYAPRLCHMLGNPGGEHVIASMDMMYATMLAHLTREERLALLVELAVSLPIGEESARALTPFITRESDVGVISSAAIDVAMLMPPSEDKPLAGPAYLAELAMHAEIGEAARVGLVQALLLLGDRRVQPFIERVWQLLTPEQRTSVTHARSGLAYASMIEFYMAQLDEEDEVLFGALAAALAQLPLQTLDGMKPDRVSDVERRFPSSMRDTQSPLMLKQEWSVAEYGGVIADKLRALAARESEPKILPLVMYIWGIDPPDSRSVLVRQQDIRTALTPGGVPDDDREKVTGILAALGSDVESDAQWQQTQTRIQELLALVQNDVDFKIPKQAAHLYNTYFADDKFSVEMDSYRPSNVSAEALVMLHPALLAMMDHTGPLPLVNAVEIARGADVDDVLAGPRTRSFFNNVMAPDDPRFVTIGTWMYRAALGDSEVNLGAEGKMTVGEWEGRHLGERIGSVLQSGPQVEGEPRGIGVYPLFAETAIESANTQGILPNEYEATVRQTITRYETNDTVR